MQQFFHTLIKPLSFSDFPVSCPNPRGSSPRQTADRQAVPFPGRVTAAVNESAGTPDTGMTARAEPTGLPAPLPAVNTDFPLP